MYKVKSINELQIYGFKRYDSGFSKKITGGFLDISLNDMIVKKVHFDGESFIYENASIENIRDLIAAGIVKEVQDEEKT